MKTLIFIVIPLILYSGETLHALQITPSDTLVVEVTGTGTDAKFVPALIQVNAGDVIRFEVLEGMHTVTAYHPDNRRPLRIPDAASSFDSGMLNKGDVWLLKIDEKGVYDYFCMPHERLGHVGRILVGTKEASAEYDNSLIPKEAARIFSMYWKKKQQKK
ncbi:plastocyanin/azurin family copper-binding protein [Gracilimonas sp.]|uniref:cupredoxin domain-containing protein n=1 Tax=Gracilimonas sp. TaxID=1974203 RepID=UPI0032EBD04B